MDQTHGKIVSSFIEKLIIWWSCLEFIIIQKVNQLKWIGGLKSFLDDTSNFLTRNFCKQILNEKIWRPINMEKFEKKF